jgi:hypothetical protein
MMRDTWKATMFCCFAPAASMAAAHATELPAALVESVSAPVSGVRAMDYLAAGRTVELGNGTEMVVDYLRACVRETITGGTVRIGNDRSEVKGGRVSRKRFDCDGGDLALAASQSDQGAVAVYRAPPDSTPRPSLTLWSTTPFIIATTPGTLRIERLDAVESAIELPVAADPGTGHAVVDLARDRKSLSAGGLYRATIGTRSIVIRIDPSAAGADAPIVSRMLPL